nr:MAG TPA: hypothetical protein [Caudoviricetes sp.]
MLYFCAAIVLLFYFDDANIQVISCLNNITNKIYL